MQSDHDPLVLVVPLGQDTPPWSTLSWRDLVYVRHIFFRPIGGRGYPNEPAEQLAFRHDAHLQAIASIEEVVTVRCRSEFSKFASEIDGEACRLAYDDGRPVRHYVYRLKDIVIPKRRIPAGTVYRARKVIASLSSLLSSESISDAVARTREQRLTR